MKFSYKKCERGFDWEGSGPSLNEGIVRPSLTDCQSFCCLVYITPFRHFFFLNCEYTYFLLAKKDISIKVEQITKVTPKLTRSNNLSPSDLTTLQNESKMKPVWFLPIYLFLVASRELSVSNKRSLHTSYYRPNNTGYYDRSVNLVN